MTNSTNSTNNTNNTFVITEDGHLRCPHCGEDDSIFEEDQAIRHNGVELVDDGLLVSPDSNYTFDTVRWFCDACDGPVELPLGVEVYWS